MTRPIPELRLADWSPTRDTLHQYARIIGKIHSQYMPKSKHWWHATLQVTARGLTTTPFPIRGENLELTLDLAAHRLAIGGGTGAAPLLFRDNISVPTIPALARACGHNHINQFVVDDLTTGGVKWPT